MQINATIQSVKSSSRIDSLTISNSEGTFQIVGKYLPDATGMNVTVDYLEFKRDGKPQYQAQSVVMNMTEYSARQNLEVCGASPEDVNEILSEYSLEEIKAYLFYKTELLDPCYVLEIARDVNRDYQVCNSARAWDLSRKDFKKNRLALHDIYKKNHSLTPLDAVELNLMDVKTAISKMDSANKLDLVELSVLETLNDIQGEGHSYGYIREISERVSDKLKNTHTAVVRAVMKLMELQKFLTIYDDAVYLSETRLMELAVRDRFTSFTCPSLIENFPSQIERYEDRKGMYLTHAQRNAVKTALTHQSCVITGGPGTGKSSIIDALLSLNEENEDLKVVLCAPTGKAASRMEETSSYNAVTIHKLLEADRSGKFNIEEGSLDADLIIVDESSMLDLKMAAALCRAAKPDARFTFIGDINQLQSVSYGDVLNDLMKILPTVSLTRSFRQDSGSSIATNAERITTGSTELRLDSSYKFIDSSAADISRNTVSIFWSAVNKFGDENVMILTPLRKNSPTGCESLNEKIAASRKVPKGTESFEVDNLLFYEGDRIMFRENNRKACNGEIGRISKIDGDLIHIVFKKHTEQFLKTELSGRVEYAWALTVHKSQGSEAKIVILVCDLKHTKFTRRNLYTAVTRAKKLVLCIGDKKAIRFAIEKKEAQRRSGIYEIERTDPEA